jgi:TDG/mug DNA glycosylase family protein
MGWLINEDDVSSSTKINPMILPDVLYPDLDIVFCGMAAGDKSALRKAYYAGPGNQFYPTLHTCGFTSRRLEPEEYTELTKFRIGLTDLAKLTHGRDHVLKQSDFDIAGLREKILRYQPKIVCFNGKKAAAIYLQVSGTGKITYGRQQQTIGQSKLFVAPSTSGAARGAWDINVWHDLKKQIL